MVIVFFIVSLTAAYQANKPCDHACFKAAMDRESKVVKKADPNDNSWRYNRSRIVENR